MVELARHAEGLLSVCEAALLLTVEGGVARGDLTGVTAPVELADETTVLTAGRIYLIARDRPVILRDGKFHRLDNATDALNVLVATAAAAYDRDFVCLLDLPAAPLAPSALAAVRAHGGLLVLLESVPADAAETSRLLALAAQADMSVPLDRLRVALGGWLTGAYSPAGSAAKQPRAETSAPPLDSLGVLQAADIGIVLFDPDMRIQFVTSQAETFLGLGRADVGRSLNDVAAGHEETLRADIAAALAEQVAQEREIQFRAGCWCLRRVAPMIDAGAARGGVAVTCMDITPQRSRIEALEAGVQRTAFENIARARFFAEANHALRQPLQSIALLHGMLARLAKEDSGRRIVRQLDQTLQSFSGMLDTVFQIEELNSGFSRARVRPFSISNVFDRLRDEFSARAEGYGIDLRLVPSSVTVKSDPLVLEMLIRSLLDHALREVSAGPILLGCRRDGADLVLQLWTEEPVLPDSVTEAATPAPTAAVTLGMNRSDFGGVGMIKRLVALLGHPLRVAQLPEGSAQVSLRLPVALQETEPLRRLSPGQDKPPEHPRTAGEAGNRSTLANTALVVIDDDQEVRGWLLAILEMLAASVTIYDSAESFLARHDLQSRYCLILDAYLPGMSGLELLEHLGDRRPPTLMITGRSDVTMAVRAMKAGAMDFVEKPVGHEELVARIERVLRAAPDPAEVAWQEATESRLAGLTPRQRQIIDLILDGHSSKVIAGKLGISQRTVEAHRATIMSKTGAKSVAALARFVLSAS